jgi:hypothetical protein
VAYIFLQIGTDPTAWALDSADLDTVAAQLSQATCPVMLPTVRPCRATW